MDTYIAKPIRADELFETIEARFLRSGEAATVSATSPPSETMWTV